MRGWCTASMICRYCGRAWQAVYPARCTLLECPECGDYNPAPTIVTEERTPVVSEN